MTGIHTVRLCPDGCEDQNKNTGLLYTAGHWLRDFAPNNVKISGDVSYRNILNTPVVVTKAKKILDTKSTLIKKGKLLKEAKKRDVKSLMTAHCSDEGWTENDGFTYLIDMVKSENLPGACKDHEGETCSCLDEDAPVLTI
ncbi:hypothetical protein RRG08_039440 [Elysia crispata]|uniref:Uncharacterized protein n=1 Tax=Elysia crispata TaxID=231223 RepID=A0AAE1DVF9_9GAST|nr:hypothetical protein RRG08_039440 [Elysia crispata]